MIAFKQNAITLSQSMDFIVADLNVQAAVSTTEKHDGGQKRQQDFSNHSCTLLFIGWR
jgi:hypothetical protein